MELLYVLLFAGIILLSYFMQQAARRRQQEEEAQGQAAQQAAPLPEEPLEDIWGRRAVPVPVPAPAIVARPAPLPVSAELPRRLHPVRALLKNKRELRRAVILMMVLGPCRSQEPPER